MNDNSQVVTRADVEEIVDRVVNRVVGDVVGTIVGDALQLIAERFDQQDQEIGSIKTDIADLKATTTRIENKLDPTIEQDVDHETRLGRLEQPAHS